LAWPLYTAVGAMIVVLTGQLLALFSEYRASR